MIRVDLHTHTNHSHARDSVVQMFEAGQKYGLAVQGFSEHSPRPEGYDYPSEYRDHLAATFDDYIREVSELREGQKNCEVLLGLEADWLEDEVPYLKCMIKAHDYDYVIAGIHFLGRWGMDSSAADWADFTQEKKYALYEQYYRTMAKMAETRLFQIVAHPDLVKIFSAGDFHAWLDMPGSMSLVRDALS
ncbi:MAG: PHP domain-containing protein, partial [Mailhella sp.]|nr:PHP domain-containing protein [Mailhella sp.]